MPSFVAGQFAHPLRHYFHFATGRGENSEQAVSLAHIDTTQNNSLGVVKA
jgi:hypothetical protein